jgi:hypothetical protein
MCTYEGSIMKSTKHSWKRGRIGRREWEYDGGGKLVQNYAACMYGIITT